MIANLLQPRSALSATCLVLVTAFLYEATAQPSSLPVPKPPSPVVPALPDAPAPFTASPRDSFAAIGDRPLFDPARKKYTPPPKPGPEKAAPPIPKVFVVGVIIDAETRIAMVKAPDVALATALTVGGQIAGWQISAIDPDRIVLKAGNSESEIRLDANKAAPVATPQHESAATEQKSSP